MEFVVFLALCFALGLLPPLRWGLRIASGLLIFLAIAAYTLPTPYDPDWGYDLLRAAVLWTTLSLLAGVALRGLHWLASDPRPEPSGWDDLALAGFDRLLMFGAGIGLGCVAFQTLAVLLQGLADGLALHLAVAAAGAAALLWRSRLRAVALGAGVVVALLALDGGLRYPDLILTDAARIRPKEPRCLMLAPDLQPSRGREDLMALTMPKDRRGPSDALLLVDGGGNPRLYRWSFRARRFVEAPRYVYAPPLCTPTAALILPR